MEILVNIIIPDRGLCCSCWPILYPRGIFILADECRVHAVKVFFS
jgi:hypothetical protein